MTEFFLPFEKFHHLKKFYHLKKILPFEISATHTTARSKFWGERCYGTCVHVREVYILLGRVKFR